MTTEETNRHVALVRLAVEKALRGQPYHATPEFSDLFVVAEAIIRYGVNGPGKDEISDGAFGTYSVMPGGQAVAGTFSAAYGY